MEHWKTTIRIILFRLRENARGLKWIAAFFVLAPAASLLFTNQSDFGQPVSREKILAEITGITSLGSSQDGKALPIRYRAIISGDELPVSFETSTNKPLSIGQKVILEKLTYTNGKSRHFFNRLPAGS